MRWVVASIAVALLVGCAPTPTWTPIAMDATAESLIATDTGVLVGGHQGQAPFLAELTNHGIAPVALHPNEPYAAAATLVRLAADGPDRYALGTAIGGAHSNARWTTWSGTPQALTNHPQEFFTFGGHDAGPLLGVAVVSHRPTIVGVRTTQTGMRAALYTADGTRWVAGPNEPTLSSDRTRELSFTAVTSVGDDLVLVGDELLLRPDLPQSPSAWIGRPGQWRQLLLPVPDGLSGPGPVWATSVACADQRCWIAGWAHGRPVVWQVETSGPTVVSTGVLDGSDTTITATALVTVNQGRPVVAVNGATPTIQLGCGATWRTLPPLPGPVQALTGTAAGVYAVSDGQVRFLDAPSC
ncbi:MAG: hypothetical protein LWW77_08760 [Propionibacteriales bacterium]|nr:hypothetical protein [Propionibacteriales bacterium]